MCLSPIRIKNKTKTFVEGLDSPYLLVPCGHCPECQKRRSNDLFVRSYFEYQETKKLGGFAQMFTLTYNEACLPKCTSLNIPCFSREDITNFLKRLRQRLCRRYGVSKSDLRYSLCSEYGGLRQRPHYHIIFFVNIPCALPSVFKKMVIDSWNFGYVSTTSINDGVITSLSGVAYVCKYCSKDTNTYNFFKSQLEFLKRKNLNNEIDELKHCMPFNRRSLGFGNFGMDKSAPYHISLENLRTRSINLPDYKCGVRTFSLPLHYVRKMLYNSYTTCNPTPQGNKWSVSFFLNELGRSLRAENMTKFIDASKKLLSQSYCNITPACVSYVCNRMSLPFESTPDYFREFKANLLRLSDNFSDEFCRFYSLYSSFTYLPNEYITNDSDMPLDEFFDWQDNLVNLKEQSFLVLQGFMREQDIDRQVFALQDLFTNKLANMLQSEKCSQFLECMYFLEYIFDYVNSVALNKCLEFEKSALYRKYVLNY